MRLTEQKKNHIKKHIEQEAIKIFLKKGYKGTTIRNISTNAGMTEGNIYCYYKNKKDIFVSIVEPAKKYVADIFSKGSDVLIATNQYKVDVLTEVIDEAAEIIKKYRYNILILLTCSIGTPYENSRKDFILQLKNSSKTSAEQNKERFNTDTKDMDFLFYTFASFWVNGLIEIVSHYKSGPWVKETIRNLVKILLAGFNSYMD